MRRKQRRDIRSGCGCITFFFAACALLGAIAPALRWLSTRGEEEDVVIANFGELSGAVVWIVAVTLISLVYGALNTRSTMRAVIGVTVVLVASWAFAYGFVYRKFIALAVRGNDVRLTFVWPRPRSTIDAHTIIDVEVVHAIDEENDMSIHMYRLEITTPEGRWLSQPTTNRAALERALAMVNGARSR